MVDNPLRRCSQMVCSSRVNFCTKMDTASRQKKKRINYYYLSCKTVYDTQIFYRFVAVHNKGMRCITFVLVINITFDIAY